MHCCCISPAAEAAAAAVVTNDPASTHICHLHSTLYLPLQPLPGYCSHNTLKSTSMHSLLLNTVYPSLTGGLPYCMRLMTPLHPLPYFSPRYIVLLGCVHVHVHKHERNMNHQRLQIVMSRQFHTFRMFSFRALDKIPSSVVCCLPFSGVAWLGWPPVKACNPLQGTQYFCFAQMIFSTAEQYSYQTFYTKADPLMHPGR